MPTVPKELWQGLYAAADRFLAAEPWLYFDDTHLFGVQDPKTKAINYCCILGAAKATFGLVVYRGERPLLQHQMILDSYSDGLGFPQVLLRLNAFMVLRGHGGTLMPEELSVLRLIGLDPAARETWPQFRSFVPGSPPVLPDAGEVSALIHILTQALSIVEQNKDKPWRFAYSGVYGSHFVRLVETTPDGQHHWFDEWVSSPLASDCSAPSFQLKDTPLARRLRQLPRRAQSSLCVDLRWIVSCCVDMEGRRPIFPQIFVVIDGDTGKVFGFELLANQHDDAPIEEHFVTTLEEVGYMPEHILTTSQRIQDLLAPLVAGTGCRVRRVGLLTMVDEFMAGLDQFIQSL